jgi:glycerol-3-phosphate dehydrogenase
VGFPSSYGREKSRFLFMVPHEGKTMIGTWYLPLRPWPDDASTAEEERLRMLGEIAAGMPGAELSADNIVSQQVGILPCTDYPGAERDEPQPTEAPAVVRGPELGEPDGVWFVQGEKWTTARMTAEAVSNMIAGEAGKTLGESQSSRVRLSGDNAGMPASWQAAESPGTNLLQRLWQRRGRQALEIPGLGDAANERDSDGILAAEARFAVEQEMAVSLSDILRRLGLGQLECPDRGTLRLLADSVRRMKGWSEADINIEVEAVIAEPRYRVVGACGNTTGQTRR